MEKLKKAISSEFWKQYNGNQSKLAREAGVDRKTVYNLLFTDKPVGIYSLFRICDALDLELTITIKEKRHDSAYSEEEKEISSTSTT